jgi:signal transduction histidine kinase
MARFALAIGDSSSPGDMREVLAEELRDPTLELAYPLADGRLVDASGERTTVTGQGRATTALVRDGTTIAVLTHRASLAADHQLVEDVVSAARLPLDNERLSAQARAQVAELAASQLRIIEAGEVERRRLERDLHDGAQQRLVALMLTLRLARSITTTAADAQRIDTAIGTLREVIAAVRRLAAGIYPSVLAEAGLASGLAALAEESHYPVRVLAVPARRLPAVVETTAYLLISTVARGSAVAVSILDDGQNLTVDVEADALPDSLTDVEDRIGALGGTLTVRHQPGRPSLHASLPCG